MLIFYICVYYFTYFSFNYDVCCSYNKIKKMKLLTLILLPFISFSLFGEYIIEVSISEQRLYLIRSNGNVIRSYPISSSAYGEGQIENSLKTPLGKHEVSTKIGTNVPKYQFFVSREHISQRVEIIHEAIDSPDDFITTRIMWLTGLTEGFNRGGNVDSFNRFIYIHGTHEEGLIGKKASHGCIRMLNHDVLELFRIIPTKTAVNISV